MGKGAKVFKMRWATDKRQRREWKDERKENLEGYVLGKLRPFTFKGAAREIYESWPTWTDHSPVSVPRHN